MRKKCGKKVFVAVSGGVDSSVSLYLLKKNGFNPVGVFIKVWQPPFMQCTWPEERRDAMRVCSFLSVPFITFDLEKEYKEKIIDETISQYKKGITPNPDVLCNKFIKFGSFYKKAKSMGADFIATGHYARKEKKGNKFFLKEGVDKNKDQSYFLWTLNQEILSHLIFPIGEYTKEEVRKIARKNNLITAGKKDSQGLCFVGKLDFKDFLKRFVNIKKGNILDVDGKKIGWHEGAFLYTVGQRHGFTLISKKESTPYYVVSKDIKDNTITVSSSYDKKEYGINEVNLKDINWIEGIKPNYKKKYKCRARYRQKKIFCSVDLKEKKHKVFFTKKIDDIAEGQSLVIYEKETIIGGGVISY